MSACVCMWVEEVRLNETSSVRLIHVQNCVTGYFIITVIKIITVQCSGLFNAMLDRSFLLKCIVSSDLLEILYLLCSDKAALHTSVDCLRAFAIIRFSCCLTF